MRRQDGAPLKVLIVEDRADICARLEAIVGADPAFRVCAVAGTLRIGSTFLARHQPDLLLVDLGLPDGSGEDLIRAAAGASWPCASLVISVFGDEERVISALRAGARGYIYKGDRVENIGQALLSVVEGGSPISPQVARHLLSLLPMSTDAGAGPEDAATAQLTNRERAILDLIAAGYRRQEVAERLNIALGTVGTHIHNIYRKLEVSSNTEAIAAAGRKGLL